MQLFNVLDSLKLTAHQVSQYAHRSELNVLFVSPEATGANFYKMIVPYAILQNTSIVRTAITGWSKYNPIKRFRSDDKSPINSVQIVWSDTIVLPFTNQPIGDFVDMAKTINPNTMIVMHIDFDFIDLPKTHPLKDAFSLDKTTAIINNIKKVDKVIVTNNKLATYLITRLQEMGHDISRDKFGVQLLCYDEDLFLEGVNQKATKDDTFTVCVLAGDNQWSDIESCVPALIKAKKKYKNNLKILFFGINKNKEGWGKIVKGLEYTPEGAVPIWKYYHKLAELNPHLVLVPSDKSDYTLRSSDYKRFIDCAILGIPVITPKANPYDVLIKDKENGFLYDTDEDFCNILDTLIADPKLAIEAGGTAKVYAEDNLSYNRDKIQRLINLLG